MTRSRSVSLRFELFGLNRLTVRYFERPLPSKTNCSRTPWMVAREVDAVLPEQPAHAEHGEARLHLDGHALHVAARGLGHDAHDGHVLDLVEAAHGEVEVVVAQRVETELRALGRVLEVVGVADEELGEQVAQLLALRRRAGPSRAAWRSRTGTRPRAARRGAASPARRRPCR